MPEKREIVEQTAQDFEKLPNDMKMGGGCIPAKRFFHGTLYLCAARG